MAEPTMAEVMESINGVLDDFDQITRSAHGLYRSYDPAILIEHSVGAAAKCTHDLWLQQPDGDFLIEQMFD